MKSALVTGAASGIGKAISEAFARDGYALTLADIDMKALDQDLVPILREAGATVHSVALDVRSAEQQRAVFKAHLQRYNGLDVAVLCAGIAEQMDFIYGEGDKWEATLDIDLRAVMIGARLAVRHMLDLKRPGAVISVSSASGVYPVPAVPVYSAAKGGLVHFTRALAPRVAKHGIRVSTVCPQFVDTPMVRGMLDADASLARRVMGPLKAQPLLTAARVADLVLRVADLSRPAGTVVVLAQDGSEKDPFEGAGPPPGVGAADKAGGRAKVWPPADERWRAWALASTGPKYKKLEVYRLSMDFDAATRLVDAALPGGGAGGAAAAAALPPGHVLIRQAFAGVNAGDTNWTAGRYHGTEARAKAALPYTAGFEAVGVVAALGAGVTGVKVGDSVGTFGGGFSEWGVAPAKHCLPLPSPTPDMLALMTSGLTASIAFEAAGGLQAGQKVLVTAAAGGTGQFAVQLAALAGCHVVATCGGPAKAALLRQLGAHRVIDYTAQDVKAVLKAEYKSGVDVVYESVGGDMFRTAIAAIAPKGRVIIIGMMSQYHEGDYLNSTYPGLCEKLLWKSASLVGFFLLQHRSRYGPHLSRLAGLRLAGRLHVALDPAAFVGVPAARAAVRHLQSGRSAGKVVVRLAPDLPHDASGSGADTGKGVGPNPRL